MGLIKLIPPPLRATYLTLRGIPYTKGYQESFDENYEEKSKKYIEYQSVVKRKHKIETTLKQEKGLARKTREQEEKLVEAFKREKYPFQNPGIFLNPYGRSPLCAYVMFYTEEECRVRFRVEGKTEDTSVADEVKGFYCWHRVPVYGLYAGIENKVLLELIDKDGQVIDRNEIKIKTAPLTDVMEDAVRVEKRSAPSSMKLILVAGKSTTYPAAFDQNGDIR